MKIIAEKILSQELKPGELFSTADQKYWDTYDKFSVGQKVYIRTEFPCPESELNIPIYRIKVVE